MHATAVPPNVSQAPAETAVMLLQRQHSLLHPPLEQWTVCTARKLAF